MKNIILLLVLVFAASVCNAQYYKLKTPLKGLFDTANYIKWEMHRYPSTYECTWMLVANDSSSRPVIVPQYHYTLPDSVINQWGTDDDVIPAYLEYIKVWTIKREE